MRVPERCSLAAVLLAALLPASPATAQPIARTFADLQTLLSPGEYVLIVDHADRSTWGRISEISPTAMTVVTVLKSDNRIETTSDRRVFAEDNVRVVFRSDPSGSRGAGVYPASWDRVETLPAGVELTVVLGSGERRHCRSAGTTPDGLRVLSATGQHELLKKSDVIRIERRRIDDGVGNGIAIGALAGVAGAAGLVAAAYATCGRCDAPARGPMFLTGMGMGAGIGAVAGWAIDKAHKGKEVIFPAVAPIVTRDRKGIALSMRF